MWPPLSNIHLGCKLEIRLVTLSTELEMHLISFVGTTDGQLAPERKGPILTAVSELRPAEVTLIVTEGDNDRIDYQAYAGAVKKAIASMNPDIKVRRVTMDLNDPADHNDIYPKLRAIVSKVSESGQPLVAAISSGTPSMQVCWILLAESGEATIKLIRTVDPALSKKTIRDVKLGIGLPRIQALEEENSDLQAIAIPPVTLYIRKGILMIGKEIVNLSPRMFTYYRYFLERSIKSQNSADAMLEVRGVFVGGDFSTRIVAYHEESFPEKEDEDIHMMSKKNLDFESSVFRSTISKLNKRITDTVKDPRVHRYLVVRAEGPKSARQYFVTLPPSKISIVKR